MRLVRADRALLDAAVESDDALATALGHAVVDGWATFTGALERLRDEATETAWGPRLFVAGEPGELVGWGGFKGPPSAGTVELGYEIAESRRGRSLASAAVRAMVAEALMHDGVQTMIAHTLPGPNASTRVLEKAGFRFDGEVSSAGATTWRHALPRAVAIALRSFALMESGTRADFEALVHPDCVNHEAAKDEPPAARQTHGPAAVHATAMWLHEAFADLRWEIHNVVADGDLVVVHCTMSGRHTGPFVAYDGDARVKEVFPPTGLSFATTQTHWIRVADGLFAEHWANRDDLGTAEQCGWVPPTPRYLVRMALAKRRAARAQLM